VALIVSREQKAKAAHGKSAMNEDNELWAKNAGPLIVDEEINAADGRWA
jgi:hypothetical protein